MLWRRQRRAEKSNGLIIMQNNISARAAHFCTFLSVFARLARETQRDVYEKRDVMYDEVGGKVKTSAPRDYNIKLEVCFFTVRL